MDVNRAVCKCFILILLIQSMRSFFAMLLINLTPVVQLIVVIH